MAARAPTDAGARSRVAPARPFAADPNRCASSGNPPGCIPLPNEMNACNGDMWKDASPNVCTQDAAVNASPNELFGVSGMG